ncbi:carbohydrate-binding family V/XII protein [Hansschlegelia beijingensis]|uniref:Carbohydrate-binding family V/XII protein n=1 Tax=Hansschlegelia beijingensis TaxID=1133344 RepID=A0A7W6CWS6_9HYPH|nr:carbohydrate-binding family V/XII protein [Hansschlegelia beijingensis]MBB3972516.1 hypothetical protein [Hansschlegelia beijingensis]
MAGEAWGKEFAAELVDSVKRYVAQEIASHDAGLEARIKALEERPALEYRGVWDGALLYSKGNVVTDGGSMWFCNRETKARPGSSGCWTLAVKKGADAK